MGGYEYVCLRPFDFSEEYVFSSEVMSANKGVTTLGTQTNNGNIKAPAESSIMKHLWAECKGRVENPNSVRWSTTGPLMIAPAVEKFSLKGYVRPPHDLCPVMAWDVAKFVQTTPLEIPSTAYAVHLWNEIWRWENLDKNGSFPPGCAYEQLKRRFMDRGTPGIIQSLWVGGRLSNMEKLSIASYLHYGEKFHLYTYGPVEGVPEGVVIKDANEIVPQSDISKFQNMANFSDWFRYNLLFKKGNWWVDIDTVLLRPFDFKDEHIFVNQYADRGHKDQVNGDYIKAPAGSEIMKWLIDSCWRKDWKRVAWSDIGPNLVTEAVQHFNITPLNANVSFNPWSRACVEGETRVNETAYAIHLVRNNWKGRWDTGKPLDLDATYPPTCLYEQLKSTYIPTLNADLRLSAPWLGSKSRTSTPRILTPPLGRGRTLTNRVPPLGPVINQVMTPIAIPEASVGASQDWRGTLLGAKVARAMARGFKVAAVCPLGSSYHKQLSKAIPKHIEEIVDTPEGKRVLLLVR